MKAIVLTKYGPPEALQLREIDKPAPKDNEALVRIHSASINAADVETLRGVFIVRMTSPLKPMYKILGSDIAGRIEAVGRNVELYQPGDEIWGDLSFPHGYGAFAEYICIPETALRLKPPGMTFEQAAAIPTAGVVALQNLVAKRPIQRGQKVLINGAGGGVGTFAVQIAKHFGAEVTAVDSAKKLDMLRAVGADHVIDYAREDFARSGKRYDLILDVVVHRSVFDYNRALMPSGICIMVGGSMARVFLAIVLGPLVNMMGSKKIGMGMWKPNDRDDLKLLAELFDAGKVKPIIDRVYPLSKTAEAFRYLEEGHAQGKVVIAVAHNDES
jgi:NADPH:quinone reductase-like Zn-dependent oxidoreductase